MHMSYQELLNYDIPEVRHRYTERDTALYALSLGVAQDPLDRYDLEYVDGRYGPKVLPSMAVVLGYPGFWLKDPAIGADVVRLLHGEQGVEILHPIPSAGEVLGKTRVVEIIDKGEKGLLLYSEKTVTDVNTGICFARTRATHVLRGAGGMVGAAKQSRPVAVIPQHPADRTVRLQTRPEQALFYRLNGDYNPLHSDPDVAEKAGFERPILHGLCSFGIMTHAISKHLQLGTSPILKSLSLRLSGVVFPGETLEVDIWKEGYFQARVPVRGQVVIDNGTFEFSSS